MKTIKLTIALILTINTLALSGTINLGQMNVTAFRSETNVEDLTTNITVITSEQIQNTNDLTLNEIIGKSVGISDVTQKGSIGSESSVKIRGSNSNQVLIMIDGQPITDASLGSTDIGALPLDMIERIEIIRGPASAVWGSNAIGGVINIITKQAESKKLKSNVSIMGGSFNRKRISLGTSIVTENDIKLLGQASHDTTKGFRDHSDFHGNNFFTKMSKDFTKLGNLDLRIFYTKNSANVPGMNFTPISNYDGATELTSTSPNANQKDDKLYLQLSNKKKLSDNYSAETRIYTTSSKRLYKDPDAFTDTTSNTTSLGGEIEITAPYEIVSGININSDKFKRTNGILNTTEINKDILTTSLFAEKKFLYKNLTTLIGLRFDNNSEFGAEFNPRSTLLYKVDNNNKLSLNIGRSFRAPTFEDLYSPYTSWPASFWGNAGDTQGNINVKPETAWGFDIGIENVYEDFMTTRLTLFRNNVKDLIQWDEVDPSLTYDEWKPTNIGKSYQQGIELEIDQYITDDVSQRVNLTVVENKGKNPTDVGYKTLPYTRPITLNYGLTLMTKIGVLADFNIHYHDETTWYDSFDTRHKLDNYTLADIHLKHKLDEITIFLSVFNIGDVDYQNIENYPLPAREFRGGIEMKF